MRWTINRESTGRAAVCIPAFEYTGAGKRGAKNARRMTEFYRSLWESIKTYTASDAFPAGGRYRGDCTVSCEGERLWVTLELRVRVRGRTQNSLCTTQIWQDGVIVENTGQGG